MLLYFLICFFAAHHLDKFIIALLPELVLVALFILATLIQLYYYLFVFTKLALLKAKEDDAQGETVPVSVIIAARNEAKNLKKNLPYILNQSYDKFEVIVVNDCSWDSSLEVLEELKKECLTLKIVDIPEHDRYKHGKKFALTLGIKAAKYEHLLFTDADCVPKDKDWIRSMQSAFTGHKEIVLGFSPYKKYMGPLNAFIRFETFMTALQYFSFALSGKPYMGVGRNLAYKKDLFFRNKGFASHIHLLSGDDDLFVNETATSDNTAVRVSKKSFVISEPKRSVSEYLRQKLRHLSAGKLYSKRDKTHLINIAVSALLFYACLAYLLSVRFDFYIVAGVFAARFLVQSIVLFVSMKKLNTFDLWWLFPVIDVLYVASLPLFAFLNLFMKKQRWN